MRCWLLAAGFWPLIAPRQYRAPGQIGKRTEQAGKRSAASG